jgi:hypothetical protein
MKCLASTPHKIETHLSASLFSLISNYLYWKTFELKNKDAQYTSWFHSSARLTEPSAYNSSGTN